MGVREIKPHPFRIMALDRSLLILGSTQRRLTPLALIKLWDSKSLNRGRQQNNWNQQRRKNFFMFIHSHRHLWKEKAYQVTQSGLSECQKWIFLIFKKEYPRTHFIIMLLKWNYFWSDCANLVFSLYIKFYISVCHCSPFSWLSADVEGTSLSLGAYLNIFTRFSPYPPGVTGWEMKLYSPQWSTGNIQVLSNLWDKPLQGAWLWVPLAAKVCTQPCGLRSAVEDLGCRMSLKRGLTPGW